MGISGFTGAKVPGLFGNSDAGQQAAPTERLLQ